MCIGLMCLGAKVIDVDVLVEMLYPQQHHHHQQQHRQHQQPRGYYYRRHLNKKRPLSYRQLVGRYGNWLLSALFCVSFGATVETHRHQELYGGSGNVVAAIACSLTLVGGVVCVWGGGEGGPVLVVMIMTMMMMMMIMMIK